MADIELVIKIPEESYNILKSGCFIVSGERSGKTILQQFCRAIHNGTLLPKDHGRLIDADELEECTEIMNTIFGDSKYAVRMSDIRNMATLIEADKEEKQNEKT